MKVVLAILKTKFLNLKLDLEKMLNGQKLLTDVAWGSFEGKELKQVVAEYKAVAIQLEEEFKSKVSAGVKVKDSTKPKNECESLKRLLCELTSDNNELQDKLEHSMRELLIMRKALEKIINEATIESLEIKDIAEIALQECEWFNEEVTEYGFEVPE